MFSRLPPSTPARRRLFLVALTTLALGLTVAPGQAAPAPDDSKLRVICFGAHPDDCEIQAGGTAALWAAKGHKVKFVSVTNGDIGHWREAGGPLAKRRLAEVLETARILGFASEVLDIHPWRHLYPSPFKRFHCVRLNWSRGLASHLL